MPGKNGEGIPRKLFSLHLVACPKSMGVLNEAGSPTKVVSLSDGGGGGLQESRRVLLLEP